MNFRNSLSAIAILSTGLSSASAFTPGFGSTSAFVRPRSYDSSVVMCSTAGPKQEIKFFMSEDVVTQENNAAIVDVSGMSDLVKEMEQPKKAPKAKKAAGKKTHNDGIFTPLVVLTKSIVGEEKFNKFRGDVINLHSSIIKGFVETSDTKFGQTAMERLFSMLDADKNGILDKEEFSKGLKALGFTWLKEKQTEKIFERADLDGNGTICIDEFKKETPKTLKTNLVKLAKKNGNDLGFLS